VQEVGIKYYVHTLLPLTFPSYRSPLLLFSPFYLCLLYFFRHFITVSCLAHSSFHSPPSILFLLQVFVLFPSLFLLCSFFFCLFFLIQFFFVFFLFCFPSLFYFTFEFLSFPSFSTNRQSKSLWVQGTANYSNNLSSSQSLETLRRVQ